MIDSINELGYVGAGKKYEVSDNSIRNWIKQYKKQASVGQHGQLRQTLNLIHESGNAGSNPAGGTKLKK